MSQPQSPTFYWHDYETWGLNPRFDRPSQFAGIRTDLDFNMTADPDMFYCRLSDDYLPTVESAIVTGITPEITQTEGLAEYEFARRINQQFTQVNTCVVGYNSLRFDEEFSRNLFYRNFYDPYEYAWKNGNTRWDIIDLVRAAFALRPKGINWPENEDGLPSFRLELLTSANGISHEHAHDATSDVYATIAIAKLIKEKAPKLFNYYFELRHKDKVKALINVVEMTPLVHVSGMFGAARGNTSLVAPISWHPSNSNAVIVVDLTKDISPLLELSADEIRERLYTKHDQLADKPAIPLKLVHINKCPFIAVEKALLPEDAERLRLDRETCIKSLEILRKHPQVIQVATEVFQQEKPYDNKDDVDAMLYDGFFSYDDKRAFEVIRHATTSEKLAGLNVSGADKRFKSLFFRYKARNFPSILSKEEQVLWEKHRQTIFFETKESYFSSLQSFSQQYKGDEKKLQLIDSLYRYAQKITADN